MKRDVGLIGGIVALLFLVGAAHSTIWYVHPDSALNSIQAGLDSCADNDIVLVGPGTYVENIVWPNTQGIHLISELGPEMTIVDGNSDGSVIRIASALDTTTIINRFTIQNGNAVSGGGISCYNNTSPTITGNTITNNSANVYGSGIFCGSGCSPIISNNAITNNVAGGPIGGAGGGIFCDSNSLAIILDNTITNNGALSIWDGSGGGICCRNYNGIINGNTITGNHAFNHGGGIVCDNSEPFITGNTITGNTVWYGSGGGGISCINSSPTIDSCTIAYNDYDGVYCADSSEPEIHYCDIFDNIGHGVCNVDAGVTVDADSNWWGNATGPYHPTANPGGLGDTVSDYVDFEPWLQESVFPGIEEQPIVKPIETHKCLGATIFSGPLQLPKDKKCKVFDITGRVVTPNKIKLGIYFVEVDGKITRKVVKVR